MSTHGRPTVDRGLASQALPRASSHVVPTVVAAHAATVGRYSGAMRLIAVPMGAPPARPVGQFYVGSRPIVLVRGTAQHPPDAEALGSRSPRRAPIGSPLCPPPSEPRAWASTTAATRRWPSWRKAGAWWMPRHRAILTLFVAEQRVKEVTTKQWPAEC
jgi:hypothetical protein